MLDPVQIKYRSNYTDMVTAYRYVMRFKERGMIYRASNLAAWIALAAGAFFWAARQEPVIGGVLLVWGAYWLLVRRQINLWWFGRHCKRIHGSPEESRIEFSEEGIHSETKDSEGTVKWSGVVRWRETPEGFLFYMQDDIFHWVPYLAFDTQTELQSVKDLARKKVAAYELI